MGGMEKENAYLFFGGGTLNHWRIFSNEFL
jgi:hypothetical protein